MLPQRVMEQIMEAIKGSITEQLQHVADPASLTWRTFRRDPFWRVVPAWRELAEQTFLDFHWQEQNSITSAAGLSDVMGELVSTQFIDDFAAGLLNAPMSVRVSPYLLSLIDWSDPYHDPIRRQFL